MHFVHVVASTEAKSSVRSSDTTNDISSTSTDQTSSAASTVVGAVNDVSVLVQKATSVLSELDRVSLLTQYFIPPPSWKGPIREIGNTARRPPAVLFDKVNYPYVSYSVAEDGAYCAACVSFSNCKTTTVLVTRPLLDWSNAKRMLEAHEMSADHRTAVSRASEFLKVCNQQQGSVRQQLSKAYNDKVEKNKAALVSIVHTLLLCGRQNIALRGHNNDAGNCVALLKFRTETDSILKQHLASAPRNAQYVSPKIQNELINLCGQQVKQSIIAECRRATFYTLLLDECADVSNTEQISLCLRYVDVGETPGSHHVVKEQFITFIPTRDTTGETIAKVVMKQLSDMGLYHGTQSKTLCTMVGQGYDGAANMSGHIRGVQARIKKKVCVSNICALQKS